MRRAPRLPLVFTSCILSLAAATADAAAAQPPAQAGAAEAILVHAGRLLADPATGRVETEKTLVVADGRIREIRDGYSTGPGRIIDLRDSFVLPGLIDSHVHILFEIGPSGELDLVKKTAADRVVDGGVYARRTLEAGFTTVVDLGGDPDAVYALRDGIAQGKLVGPRIIAAGGVGVHGGHGSPQGFRRDVIDALTPPGTCSGPADCRRATRQAVQNGADLIKIATTGGVLTAAATGVGQQMFDDEIVAIVETARSLGRRVAAHAHGTDGIHAALRADVGSIEHGTYLDAEAVRMMHEAGTYLVPTLIAGETVRAQAATSSWMPPSIREKALQVGTDMVAATRRAREADVNVAFGTDSGVSPHGENAREFALMVAAGYAPLDAIRSATVGGAALNGLSGQVGTLGAGMAADIIAVRGNPLEDVTELERVTFVMKGGTLVRHTAGTTVRTDGGRTSGR